MPFGGIPDHRITLQQHLRYVLRIRDEQRPGRGVSLHSGTDQQKTVATVTGASVRRDYISRRCQRHRGGADRIGVLADTMAS